MHFGLSRVFPVGNSSEVNRNQQGLTPGNELKCHSCACIHFEVKVEVLKEISAQAITLKDDVLADSSAKHEE